MGVRREANTDKNKKWNCALKILSNGSSPETFVAYSIISEGWGLQSQAICQPRGALCRPRRWPTETWCRRSYACTTCSRCLGFQRSLVSMVVYLWCFLHSSCLLWRQRWSEKLLCHTLPMHFTGVHGLGDGFWRCCACEPDTLFLRWAHWGSWPLVNND